MSLDPRFLFTIAVKVDEGIVCDMPHDGAVPVLVFPIGGTGERMGSSGNKALIELPGVGTSILEYSFRTWNTKIDRLVLLVPAEFDDVKEVVDALTLPCEVHYSPDPFPKCGRTRALAHAIETRAIPSDAIAIIHNPDDLILDYPGDFADDVLSCHRQNVSSGSLATVVASDCSVHSFTAFDIDKNRVVAVEHSPVWKKSAHVGITLFEPAILPGIVEASSQGRTSDFERDVFDKLCSDSRLGAFVLRNEYWIAVNTRKDLQLFAERYQLTQ